LINTLRGGSAALEGFQKQAEALGIAVGRDTIRGVEEANDAVNRLKKSWEGLFNVVAVRAAPYMELIADGIVRQTSSEVAALDAHLAEVKARRNIAALRPRFSAFGEDPYEKFLIAEAKNLY